jgi:hypothetical protein
MIALSLLALLELFLSSSFVYMFLSGNVSEYILGGLMIAQLLVIALALLAYYKALVPFREITEDRDEAYLW